MSTPSLFLPALAFVLLSGGLAAQELIPVRSAWRYMDDGVDRYSQSPPFYAPGYSDAAWKTGPARIGYGGDGETTTALFGPSSSAKYITTWFRREFTWDGTTPLDADTLLLEFSRDDGAMIYLNGNLVERSNMPTGTVGATTVASSAMSGNDEWKFFQKHLSPSLLVPGRNVLAVAVHQNAPDSSDLGWDLRAALTRRDLLFKQTRLGPPGVDALCGLMDVNGDGAPELFTAIDYPNTSFDMRWNDGHGKYGPLVQVDNSITPERSWAANLNGDALPDMLAVNSETILAFRNDGGERLVRTASLLVSTLYDAQTGDLDGDGLDDLAEVSFINGVGTVEVRWRRNAGGGAFANPVSLNTLHTTFTGAGIAVFDANGDGRRDILVSGSVPGIVRLLINQGGANPSFTASTVVTGIANIGDLAAADFDGDGDRDFVAASRPGTSTSGPALIHTFLNNGSGVFTRQPVPVPLSIMTFRLQLEDMDADDDPDLVFSEAETGIVTVMEGDGRGNWVHRRDHPSPLYTYRNSAIEIGDVDADGMPDLVHASRIPNEPLSWYRNLRTSPPRINSFAATPGTIGSPGTVTLSWDVENATSITISGGVTVPEGAASVTVNIADDANFTLTATNRIGSATADTLVQIANLRFSPLTLGADIGSQYYGGTLIDVDRDGLKDIAYRRGSQGASGPTVWVRQLPGRIFGEAQIAYEFGDLYPPAAADMNGDGREDLVTGYSESQIVWLPVNSGGGFGPPRVVSTTNGLNSFRFFTVNDFDGDGDQDVAALMENSSVRVLLNNGSGSFTVGPALNPVQGFRTDGIRSQDLDKDGRAELILPQDTNSTVIAWNQGGANFGAPVRLIHVVGLSVAFCQGADFNGDGFIDLVTIQDGFHSGDTTGGHIVIEFGNGDRLLGTRGGRTIFPNVNNTRAFNWVNPVDMDLDGDIDLMVSRDSQPAISYALNNGHGEFSDLFPMASLPANFTGGGERLLSGDLDGNGFPDGVLFFSGGFAPLKFGAAWNDGPPPPVVQLSQTATVIEAGAVVDVPLSVTGLKRATRVELTRLPSSTADVAELTLAPPAVPVPGAENKWSVTLQPGVTPPVLRFSSPDDIPAEAAETVVFNVSSPDAAAFSNGTQLTVTVAPNDYAVTTLNPTGPGSLTQALANASHGALIAERSGAAAEIVFSESGGVPFLTVPQTIALTAPAEAAYPVLLRGPAGRLTLQLSTAAAKLVVTGGSSAPAGVASRLEDLEIVRDLDPAAQAVAVTLNAGAPVTLERFRIQDRAGIGVAVTGFGALLRNGTVHGCGGPALRSSGLALSRAVNCTFSGNGGQAGVVLGGRGLKLVNCTVTDNQTTGVLSQGGAMELQNTIVAGNRFSDVSGSFSSLGGNVIGIADGSTGLGADRTGSAASPLDVMLAPLADMGGPGPVHALLSFSRLRQSPAINAGVEAALTEENFGPPPWLDQRGEPRVFPVASGRVDAGAFEIQNTPPYLTGDGLPAVSVLEDAAARSFRLADYFDDAEDGPAGLSFSITENTAPSLLLPALTAPGADTRLSLAFTRDTTGSGFITITATDRAGVTVSSRFAVEVTPAVDPVLTARVLDSPAIGGGGAQDIFEFSVLNRGPSTATALTLQQVLTLPADTVLESAVPTRGQFDSATGRWTLDLPENGLALLTVRLRPADTAPGGLGNIRASLSVQQSAPALTGSTEDDSATAAADLISPRDLAVDRTAQASLVRQTGLTVQRVVFTNNNPLPLAALRIHVSGLGSDWQLHNATGSDAAGPYVDLPAPLAPGESRTLTFEYYSAARGPLPALQYTASILRQAPEAQSAAAGSFEITRILPLAGGDVLLEWPSAPGKQYQVQYSIDLQQWRASQPSVTAAGTRTQWIDNGAPKTLWPPGSNAVRYYRVAELPHEASAD